MSEDDHYLNEQSEQRVEWRSRLIKAIIGREHDDETLIDMLTAGLRQAYTEGVLDCADICDTIAVQAIGERGQFVARVLASSMRNLQQGA